MREIKFRAWNHIVGRMSKKYTIQELHEQEVNWNNIRLMQYTGLKDKYGNEIYEGDIVSHDNGLSKVEWSDKEGAFMSIDFAGLPDAEPDTSNEYPPFVRIIGNIYQNPELIKF